MKNCATFILLILLVFPFIALFCDIIGKTKNITLKTALGVTIISTLIAFGIGGLHQRPNVADIFSWALIAWPILLLVAYTINSHLSLGMLLGTVPVMSWYLVNISMQFYYPTNAGGGGMGLGLGLIAGWSYMAILFVPMVIAYLIIRCLLSMIKYAANKAFEGNSSRGRAESPHR